MNRMQEYQALLAELSDTPPELEGIMEKALKRKKTSQKKRRFLEIPAGSLAACFMGFVLLINLFPPFAAACEKIPVLRELAEAVSWSPSLSAAVEHEYAQTIGDSQTQNGITATVECVIVDRKQVNIFFTLDSDTLTQLEADYDIRLAGENFGYSSSTGSYGLENGALRQIDVNFMAIDVPDALELTLSVYDRTSEQGDDTAVPEENLADSYFETPVHAPDYLAEFVFILEFNPYFTAQGEVIPVNAPLILDGQKFTMTEVELYPTHLRVNLDDDAGNTAWLKSLDLYLENEHGERFESSINGITASGDPDGEGYATFWLDSPFFSQGEHLTLHITRATWRDKDAPMVRLDLRNGSAENLPEGVRLLKTEEQTSGWMVYFVIPREPNGSLYNLFSGSFRDEEGNEYDILQTGSSFGYENPVTGRRVENESVFTQSIPLANFHGNIVYLEPHANRTTGFEEPVSVSIK